MFISNPTPEQLVNIKRMQLLRLCDLNELVSWTDSDFNEAYTCFTEYCPEKNDWFVSHDNCLLLLGDQRTPPAKAKKLAEQMKQNIANYYLNQN